MKKKLLSLVLAMALTCSCLTACGDSSQADSRKTESSSKAETTTTAADSSSQTDTTTTTTAETTTTTTTQETTTTEETTTTTQETTTTTETTTTATTQATTQATTRATTRATTKATTNSRINANKVIYSDNNIVITYTGYDPYASKTIGGKMYFNFQSKSSHKLAIHDVDVVINGFSVDSQSFLITANIQPGTSCFEHAWVRKTGLEESGLTPQSVKTVELSFSIRNMDKDADIRDYYITSRVSISI